MRTFDVDYNDARFNSILKGRKFEICVAKALADGEGCEILEWTPDKGFLSNLNVKQNGNPDLVLKSRDGAVFAVECKYRSGYANAKGFKHYPGRWISWASKSQATRYSEFASKRNIPVYVALGVFQDAENPDKKLVVPLASLISKSANKDVYFANGKSPELLCVQHKHFYKTCANAGSWKGLIPELNREKQVDLSETIS